MKGLNEVSVFWTRNPEDLGEVIVGLEDGSYATAYLGSSGTVSRHLSGLKFHGLSHRVSNLRAALVAYVTAVEVEPPNRRRGLGSLIVRTLIETLSELGVRRVFLHAATSGGTPEEALEAFYAGLGFQAEPCCHEDRWPVMGARI